MDARSIGIIRPIEEIEPGQFVLFSVNSTTGLGVIVEIGTNTRAVLHLDYKQDENFAPIIYDITHFLNEIAVHIEAARIVPILSPEYVGFGRYPKRTISQALYINDFGVFLVAMNGHSFFTINLFNGRRADVHMNSLAYTKAWYIEVPNSSGDYEPYHEFRVI